VNLDTANVWADVLKALAHPTRLQIVAELLKGTKCVTDIQDILPASQANISQHLTVLRHAGIVSFTQAGSQRCYYVCRPKLASSVMALLAEDEPVMCKSKDDVNREKLSAGGGTVFDNDAPLLEHTHTDEPVFLPGNMLESARIQKNLPPLVVPAGCLLDFDGELVDFLLRTGEAELEPSWPCFHTRLYRWRANETEYGIIGGTVGASFAVLVAEELFTLGCQALVTISSAGLLPENLQPPLFLLIEKALRDEGTSYHYLPPERFAQASPSLVEAVAKRLGDAALHVVRGTSWTTDAPFRETLKLISARRDEGIIAVEMEAAALLAMGTALKKPVICFAHITNAMATRDDDFEKGGDIGNETALKVCATALSVLLEQNH